MSACKQRSIAAPPFAYVALPHHSSDAQSGSAAMSDSEPEEEGQDLAAMSKKEFRLHMKRQRRQGAAPPLEEEEEEDGGGATQRGAANHYGDHRKWKKVDVGDMVMGGSEGGTFSVEPGERGCIGGDLSTQEHGACLTHCAHIVRTWTRQTTQ
jgi:hypothetical protein